MTPLQILRREHDNRMRAIICRGFEIVPIDLYQGDCFIERKFGVLHHGVTIATCPNRESAIITRDDAIRRACRYADPLIADESN